MIWKKIFILAVICAVLPLGQTRAAPDVQVAQNISASPVHAGCYLAKPDRCQIHVESFTINIAAGQKLAQFRLVAIQAGTRNQTIIYDWQPDVSNPIPISGTTFTPSLVAKDFAATCSSSYEVSLEGRDTGDAGLYNLGMTDLFTCPEGTFTLRLPLVVKY